LLVLGLHREPAFAQIGGEVRSTPNTIFYAGGSCQFFDAQYRPILSVDAAEAIWSCSPAKAAWVTVSPASGGYYEFPNYGPQQPMYKLSDMLAPIYLADTIYHEAVLLDGIGSTARLLYPAKSVLAVRDHSLSTTFVAGDDFSINGDQIRQLSARVSASVSRRPGQRGNGSSNGLMNTRASSWTYVTYIPERAGNEFRWPEQKSGLPRLRSMIAKRSRITVQAIGMSITAGLNVSGFIGDERNFPPTAPYMRSYIELFSDYLTTVQRCSVDVFNSSCGGKTVAWAEKYCIPLAAANAPDLIILDMGMNDIWGTTTPSAFRLSIESCMRQLSAVLPDVEFLLIANMLPDVTAPGVPPDGAKIMKQFRDELLSLQRTGVAVLDMTSMSEKIYQRKGAAHCTSNSLHPNDYLARWYAQGLIHAVTAGASTDVHETDTDDSPLLIAYPQPASDRLSITVDQCMLDEGPLTLNVCDLSGRVVLTLPLNGHQVTLSTDAFAPGVYCLRAESRHRTAQARVVIGR